MPNNNVEMDPEFVRLVGEAAAIRHHQGCAYNNLPESALPLWAWHRAEVERAEKIAYDIGFRRGLRERRQDAYEDDEDA